VRVSVMCRLLIGQMSPTWRHRMPGTSLVRTRVPNKALEPEAIPPSRRSEGFAQGSKKSFGPERAEQAE